MTGIDQQTYLDLLRYAKRASRRDDEAEDLLQAVLLAAAEVGRADLSVSNNRRWIIGALRNRALFDARSAVRRRNREAAFCLTSAQLQSYSTDQHSVLAVERTTQQFIASLSPRLRTTALLIVTGHTKKEIAWLQQVSDAALRQRLVGLKRRWRGFNADGQFRLNGLTGTLGYGKIRQALLKYTDFRLSALYLMASTSARSETGPEQQTFLGSHDPDGHLFILNTHKTSAHGNSKKRP